MTQEQGEHKAAARNYRMNRQTENPAADARKCLLQKVVDSVLGIGRLIVNETL